jgi:hypothetical protein
MKGAHIRAKHAESLLVQLVTVTVTVQVKEEREDVTIQKSSSKRAWVGTQTEVTLSMSSTNPVSLASTGLRCR